MRRPSSHLLHTADLVAEEEEDTAEAEEDAVVMASEPGKYEQNIWKSPHKTELKA